MPEKEKHSNENDGCFWPVAAVLRWLNWYGELGENMPGVTEDIEKNIRKVPKTKGFADYLYYARTGKRRQQNDEDSNPSEDS